MRMNRVLNSRIERILAGIGIFAVLILSIYFVTIAPPRDFPVHAFITLPEGASLFELAERLEEENVVHSAFWFRTIAITLRGEHGMRAGDYYLSAKENAFTIARRIMGGEYDIGAVRLTIPEGFTIKDISRLFDERFPMFDHENFEREAKEGYLFPDTYFVGVNSTALSAVSTFERNFSERIEPLLGEIASSTMSLHEIITLASIIEMEANSEADRYIISGILHERLRRDMPLQVDATLRYVTGRTSAELTQADLTSFSPFNTYRYRGLPPAPITNPGLESIIAALRPVDSPYLYFLTGKNGHMYYAKTFEEHKENRKKHLDIEE